MTDPDYDIAKFLIDPNITGVDLPSTGGAKNLFVSEMPPDPDFAVSVIRYSGSPPTETFGNPLLIRHPRVQVMVRHTTSKDALTVAGDIVKLLCQVKDQVVNGTTYQRIKSQGEPFEIGPDSRNRQRASVNFTVDYYDSV